MLVVGLGNPGGNYKKTRHNIGHMVLDKLEDWQGLNWKDKFKGKFSQVTIGGKRTYFLKPMTFMNLSGDSVRPLMDYFNVVVEDLLVVFDEIDLPFGTLTLKKGGGFAGHNGLKSIGENLKSDKFMRIRMGIGRPVHGQVADYVLSKFSSNEEMVLSEFINLGAKAVESFVTNGFEKTASDFSKISVFE
jgi:peptidyl-tRNA hydrolase, PTH1 family